MNNKKEFISFLIPILAFYFSFCGVLYYIYFYNSFGVGIVSYLDTSEIFTGLFQFLYVEIMYNANLFGVSILISLFLASIIHKFSKFFLTKDIKKVKHPFDKYYYSLSVFVSIFLLSLDHFRTYFYGKLYSTGISDFFYIVIMALILFSLIRFMELFLFDDFNARKISKYIIAFLLSFLLFIFNSSTQQINMIKRNKGYKDITFIYHEDTIVGRDNSYFIGGIKNYIFFADTDGEGKYTVYERADIDFLKVGKHTRISTTKRAARPGNPPR
jgi:hypothetical protein